jgi:hypothetical protein
VYVEVYTIGTTAVVVEITVLADTLDVITIVTGGPAGRVDVLVVVVPELMVSRTSLDEKIQIPDTWQCRVASHGRRRKCRDDCCS